MKSQKNKEARGLETRRIVYGNLRAAAMVHQYLAVISDLTEVCRQPGLFLYVVSGTGLRQLT